MEPEGNLSVAGTDTDSREESCKNTLNAHNKRLFPYMVAVFDAADFVHTIQKLKDEPAVTGSVFSSYRAAPCFASVIHSSLEGRYAISPTRRADLRRL